MDQEFKLLIAKYGLDEFSTYYKNFIKEGCRIYQSVYADMFPSEKKTVEAQNTPIAIKQESTIECVKKEEKVETKAEVKEETKEEVKADVKEETKPESKEEVKADVKEETKPETKEEAEDEPVKKTVKKCEKKVKTETAPKQPVEQPSEEQKNNQDSTIGNVDVQRVSDETIANSSEEERRQEEERRKKEEEIKRKKEEKREQNRIAKQKLSEAQSKTAQKNREKGINPYDLLTKENLTKWIIDEEMSYAEIAKKIVGCSDKDVSLAARTLNIQSMYVGVNGMIKAGRKKKTKTKTE